MTFFYKRRGNIFDDLTSQRVFNIKTFTEHWEGMSLWDGERQHLTGGCGGEIGKRIT
jgi:hypothetical protein